MIFWAVYDFGPAFQKKHILRIEGERIKDTLWSSTPANSVLRIVTSTTDAYHCILFLVKYKNYEFKHMKSYEKSSKYKIYLEVSVICLLLSNQSLVFFNLFLCHSLIFCGYTTSMNPCFTSAASYPGIVSILLFGSFSKQLLLPGCCIILVANFDSIITRIFSNRIILSSAFQQLICFFIFPFFISHLFSVSAKTVSNIVHCPKMYYLWTLLLRGGTHALVSRVTII